MKKVKNILNFIMLFYSCLSLAQFNTLTRTSIKKEGSFFNKEIKKEEDPKNENRKDENKIIKFCRSTTKSDLKKEIDSLKTLMIKYGVSKNEIQHLNFRKIEDSLIQMMKSRIGNPNKSNNVKSLKTFDFVNERENKDQATSKIFMPLESRITVTSSFGVRVHPIFGTRKMHNGTDLKANYEKVYSVLDGIVIEAGFDSGGGGNYIKIRHSDSFVTSYLHLSEIYYKAGQFVKAGYIIAKSGNSGNSTGAHLHFSVSENGNFINPIRFLNDLIKTNNLIATYYEH